MDGVDAFLLDDAAISALLADPQTNGSAFLQDEALLDDGTNSVVPLNPKPAKKKWTRRRDRRRPYREIPGLKAQIEELQRTLQSERTKASNRARCALEAHDRNVQLKRTLSKTLDQMQTFERILAQQMDELVRVVPKCRSVSTRTLPYDAAQDAAIFRSLAKNVDDQFEYMSQVLQASGLNETASQKVNTYICRSGDPTLKSLSCFLLPFDSDTLERVLWDEIRRDEHVALGPCRSIDDLNLPLGDARNVGIRKHEIAMGDVICKMRMVVKQFDRGGHFVNVWHTLAEWPQLGNARNVKTREHGWGFNHLAKSGARLCQSYVFITPTITGVTPDESCKVIDLLGELYQDYIASRLQGLENLAVDDAICNK